MKALLLLLLLTLGALGTATPAAAADPVQPGEDVRLPLDEPVEDLATELGPPGPPITDEALLDAETRRISKGLRCPICQGSSIQDSPVQSAVDMRKRVRELLSRGYGEAAIQDYFVARYGEWVLLAPRATGLNWLVWVVPGLAGGLALGVLVLVINRWRQEPDEVPLPSETGDAPLDTYEQRLLDEIEG